MRFKASRGVSLVEVMIALAILSMLALPGFMFLFEYVRDGSKIGDYYQILNALETRMEQVYALDFISLPVGETSDGEIKGANGQILDLRPSNITKNLVQFKMTVEVMPLSFSALEGSSSNRLQRARAEDLFKKVVLQAIWGKDGRHKIELMAYKANL
jgi:prepilin-type N-terminal cleavage/methylation domain-containing protein